MKIELDITFQAVFNFLLLGIAVVLMFSSYFINNKLNTVLALMELQDQLDPSILNVMESQLPSSTKLLPLEAEAVSTTGAIRVTRKLKKGLSSGVKVVVKKNIPENNYIATIGENTFNVSADEKHLIVDGKNIPITEDEFKAFQKTPAYKELLVGKKDDPKSANYLAQFKTNNRTESNAQKSIYPKGLPGLPEALPSIEQRAEVLEKTKNFTVDYPAKNEKATLYVAWDVSCPFCRRFVPTIREFNDNGFTVKLMPIDKTRNFKSKNATEMAKLFCAQNKQDAIKEITENRRLTHGECPAGPKALESMTNAAILAGITSTPAIFNGRGMPIVNFENGKYHPVTTLAGVIKFYEGNSQFL